MERYTIDQAAESLGTTGANMRLWLSRGVVPAPKVSNRTGNRTRYYYQEKDLPILKLWMKLRDFGVEAGVARALSEKLRHDSEGVWAMTGGPDTFDIRKVDGISLDMSSLKEPTLLIKIQ